MSIFKNVIGVFIFLLLSVNSHALTKADYVKKYCVGKIKYRLPDKTRVDCLTDTHAIEYGYSYKWAEAVGQSLHYANMTGKKAGIMLICQNKNTCDIHAKRIRNIKTTYKLPLDLQIIRDY